MLNICNISLNKGSSLEKRTQTHEKINGPTFPYAIYNLLDVTTGVDTCFNYQSWLITKNLNTKKTYYKFSTTVFVRLIPSTGFHSEHSVQ
jgi:hypothetical protein